ncbi:hypothetical protein LT493_12565 [Streptomyces tricolor]|nr:hypothetical protein [Streptomyces tricolor]
MVLQLIVHEVALARGLSGSGRRGAAVGVLNGVAAVEFGRIDSFIATLGTGSVM